MEDDEPYARFDFEALRASMSPATGRNHDRHMKVMFIQMRLVRLFRWPRWPFLRLVWVFWSCLMEEGIVQTCKPRWGALTFSYLNDGMKPTLYHTVMSLITDMPIYPSGAPRNRSER